MFDIFIPTHKKDKNILNFCLKSLKHIKNFNGQIFVCSNYPIYDTYENVIYLRDTDINIELTDNNWLNQQLIKLKQNITKDEYFVIDSDTVLLEDLTVKHGKFFITNDEEANHFIPILEDKIPMNEISPYNYISEMMYFKRDVINSMINEFFGSHKKMMESVNNGRFNFSEFLLYGNYVYKYLNEEHEIQKLKSRTKLRTTNIFSAKEVEDFMVSQRKYDCMTMSVRLYHNFKNVI